MRAEIAGPLAEVRDGLGQLRLRWIGPDVEDVDLALREASRPEEAPIVGEAHVMGLVAGSDRDGVDHLAVALGLRVDVDGHQLVRPVADPVDAERPDVDVVFLSLDQLGHVRRVAGLVGE
jgi:hypothetical protein